MCDSSRDALRDRNEGRVRRSLEQPRERSQKSRKRSPLLPYCFHDRDSSMPTKTVHRQDTAMLLVGVPTDI